MQGAVPADVREQYQDCLLDMVDDGVVGTDADFRITQWNLGAERLYGYTATQVVGLRDHEVPPFAGDDERELQVRELLERGFSWREMTAVRHDGTPVEVEVVVTAVLDDA